MPREFGISGKRRGNRQAPAFIGVPIFCSGADGESWHLVEEEVQAMIVVNDNSNIRPHFVEPFVDGTEGAKEIPPVGLILQSPRDGFADRRDVRCRDSTNDLCHGYSPARTRRSLNSSSVTPRCCAPICCTLSPKMPAHFAR